MNAVITYRITEAAQRAHMAATGQPTSRVHTVTEELPAELLSYNWLVNVSPAGEITVNLTENTYLDQDGDISRNHNWSAVGDDLDTIPASGVEAIRSRIHAVAAKQFSLVEQKRQRALATEARAQEETDRKAAAGSRMNAAIDAFFANSHLRANGNYIPSGSGARVLGQTIPCARRFQSALGDCDE